MLPVCFLMLTVLFFMLSPPPFMLRGAGGRGGAFMTSLFFNADRSFFYAPPSLSYAARARLGAGGQGEGGGGHGPLSWLSFFV